MPEFDIQPLAGAELGPAAGLLAGRHGRHRDAGALLPKVTDFRAQLERELDQEQAAGLAAFEADELVAYVIGRVEADAPLGDKRAIVDFAGCAAAPGKSEAVRDLYAALAARWAAAGAHRHLALIPATDEQLVGPWLRPGFGVRSGGGGREPAPLRRAAPDRGSRPGPPGDRALAARPGPELSEPQAGSPGFSGLTGPSG